MKIGSTLQELAKKLDEIKATAKDFVVPTVSMKMTPEGLVTFGDKSLPLTNYAHSQFASYADIPKAYYDRLKDQNIGLLSNNVNHGLALQTKNVRKDGKAETRMIRTACGNLRALVSASFRRMDNYDLLNETLPLIIEKGLHVESCELTERRLYVKALSPLMKADVQVGDTVQSGIIITNSDVGAGALRVEPMIHRLRCKNGLIMATALKSYHVGSRQQGDDIYEILSDKTKQLDAQAHWAKCRDVIKASLQQSVFDEQVEMLRAAAEQRISNFDIPSVIELTMDAVGIGNEKTKNDMVAYLANGADGAGLTKWGLMNAFTFAAQIDKVDYDESVELERAASKILTLSPGKWKSISMAAA